ncbi:MAG: hypothetical protein FJ295_12915 [Planctomycetes bacterium]|nr:hypothetical protein [Planctomycetota bacterium]
MLRILTAGLLAGLSMFVFGVVEHMAFEWETRTLLSLAADPQSRLLETLKSPEFEPGMYGFPANKADAGKEPSGILLLWPRSAAEIEPRQLLGEFLAGLVACTFAAWIVSQLSDQCQFWQRWRVVLVTGLIGWLAINTSYWLWYRFSWEFTRDSLYCALLEWSSSGLIIAAIVRSENSEG